MERAKQLRQGETDRDNFPLFNWLNDMHPLIIVALYLQKLWERWEQGAFV
jgi:hypothetical protein